MISLYNHSIRKRLYVRFFLLLFLTTFVFSLSYSTTASAAELSLTLAWDANSEPVDGYRLFSRTEGQNYVYSQPVWEGADTTATVDNLDDSEEYFFVVRAFNEYGESGDSNEVNYSPSTPLISSDCSSLTISCTEGSNAPDQTFEVWNSGGGILNYSILDNAGHFLSVTPSSGSSSGEHDLITVRYSTSGLPPGDYSATITISDGDAVNSPREIAVSLRVFADIPDEPEISLNKTIISNSCTEGSNAPDQTFEVWNSGGGILNYSILDNAGHFLSVTPSSGSSSGEHDLITVRYSTSGLPPGDYSATITISDGDAVNSPREIAVSLRVFADIPDEPEISLNKTTISNSCTEGSNAPDQTFEVWNSGGGILNYSILDNAGHFLSVTPSSGSSSGEHDLITVRYSTSGLPIGNYTSAITILDENAKNSPKQIVVNLKVSQVNDPLLQPVVNSTEQQSDGLMVIMADYSSPSYGHLHTKSRWQISAESNFEEQSLVFDIISQEFLTMLPVPHGVLKPNNAYYTRVKFYDEYDNASVWSDIVDFVTIMSNGDYDGNGIPDDQEVNDTIDMNLDGIPDNDQPHVIKSVQPGNGKTITGLCKVSNSITAIEGVELIQTSSITDNRNRPDNLSSGLILFRLKVAQPGATVVVRIYSRQDISMTDRYYKYNTIVGWKDYSQNVIFNYEERYIDVVIKDGGFGDSDGIANGIIIDQGAIAHNGS